MFDDGKILLVEVSVFWKLVHLKQFFKSDHLDFVTNLRFLFLTLLGKSNEEIVNHTLNKTSKTASAGSNYQYHFHHICQEGSDAWRIVNLNRLRETERRKGLHKSHITEIYSSKHSASKGRWYKYIPHAIHNRDGYIILSFRMEGHIKLHLRDPLLVRNYPFYSQLQNVGNAVQ